MPYQKGNSPFLYDDVTGDIVGVKDADGGDSYFARLLASGALAGADGKPMRVIDGDSSRRIALGSSRPKIMSFGNSISRINCVSLNATSKVYANSYLYWMQAFLGWPFQFVNTGDLQQIGAPATSSLSYGVYGYGGATTAQMLALPEDPIGMVLAYAPDILFIQTMENDVLDVAASGHTSAYYLGLYQTILNRCAAAGVFVVWGGCLPSQSFTTAAHSTAYWALERGVQALAADNARMVYVPMWDLYTDGTSAYPVPLSSGAFANYTDATVHPDRASPLIGKRLADVMTKLGFNQLGWATSGPGDTKYMASGNVNMSGSGGTLSGSFTGSAPAGITVTNDLTTPTATASIPVVAGRQVLQADVSAGAQSGYKNALQVQGGTVASGFSVGDIVQAYTVITIRSATTPAGILTPQCQLRFIGGANDGWFGTTAASGAYPYAFPLDTPMMIASPALPVPSGTTGVRSLFDVYSTTGASSVALSAYIHSQGLINWSK